MTALNITRDSYSEAVGEGGIIVTSKMFLKKVFKNLKEIYINKQVGNFDTFIILD